MAVYTSVSAEEIGAFLNLYDVGTLVSAKGIAEGVENSNYLIETTQGHFILTLYEKRVNPADLPFFIDLLDHLANRNCPVPPMIADKNGEKIQRLCGKTACLIKFLPGVSLGQPTPEQALGVGQALGLMHSALTDFEQKRPNLMNHDGWRKLAADCGEAELDKITTGLHHIIDTELDFLDREWPDELPLSTIHADLFPDNVLMLDGKVTGLIDFYFSCTDIRVYDLAITHTAWCFSEDGCEFSDTVSKALIAGYIDSFDLSEKERQALPVLARGASLRFLLTRAFDWINTPSDALVARKNPVAFLNSLRYYQSHPEIFSS